MSDDSDRAERLSRRRQRQRETSESSEESEPSDSSEASKTSDASKPSKPSETGESSVKDEMVGTYMYLPEELKEELDLRFDELSLEHKREYGEPLEKNRDYYPAVVEAALHSEKTLEEILLNDE